MKIVELKAKTKALKEFEKREWGLVHPEHYGHEIDRDFWEKIKFRLAAKDGGKFIGKLTGHYMAGVMYIGELLVGHDYRGLGVGKALMAEAEKIAHDEYDIKKLLVISGIGVREYYRKLGYIPDGPYMSKPLL